MRKTNISHKKALSIMSNILDNPPVLNGRNYISLNRKYRKGITTIFNYISCGKAFPAI